MIKSFGSKDTESFFRTGRVPKRAIWSGVAKIALRKLDMIKYAAELKDLRSPPANRLEKLKGNLSGFYSIRINNQWRIIFQWEDGKAHKVEIIDYHS